MLSVYFLFLQLFLFSCFRTERTLTNFSDQESLVMLVFDFPDLAGIKAKWNRSYHTHYFIGSSGIIATHIP